MKEQILKIIYAQEGINLVELTLKLLSHCNTTIWKDDVYEVIDELLHENKIIALHCYRMKNKSLIKIRTVLFSADLKFKCSRGDLLNANKTGTAEVVMDRKSKSHT